MAKAQQQEKIYQITFALASRVASASAAIALCKFDGSLTSLL